MSGLVRSVIGSQNECVQHTLAGEDGNDIILSEVDEDDYMRVSSYDRTKTASLCFLRVKRKKTPKTLIFPFHPQFSLVKDTIGMAYLWAGRCRRRKSLGKMDH